jgi:hypothetical protein
MGLESFDLHLLCSERPKDTDLKACISWDIESSESLHSFIHFNTTIKDSRIGTV